MAAQVRQANYTDYSNSYNEMLFVIRQRMAELQTALPVKVIAVKPNDGHTGFVDVQPLVQQISADSTVVDHGIIYNVPYFRIQGGINGIIIDPAVGDIGLCDFCSRDISAVKNSKKIAPPASRRMHSFSDAVYIGGFLNKVPTRFIEFNDSGINVVPIEKFTYDGIEVATINDVKAADDRAKAAETAEKERAESAEKQESARANESEYQLRLDILAEQKRAQDAEAAEKARAEAAEAAEQAARIAADAVLAAAIAAETLRAQDAESTLTANLNAESTRAQNAESVLNVNIVAETTRATSAESALNININDEKTRAQGAEASLAAAISTLGGEVSSGGAALSGEIAAESTRAQAAEAALATSISTETTNRTTADTALETQISTETTNRTTADTDLQTQVTAVLGKIIGYNQDWKDKMSLRDANVTYTNSTDRPIMVNIAVGNTPSTRYFIEVNGVNIAQTSVDVLQNISFIVQIGGTYKYANPSISSSNGEIRIWAELTSSTT